MKKMTSVAAAVAAVVLFAGCGSTPKQADKPAETKTAGKKEGVEADAEKMTILDWSGRAVAKRHNLSGCAHCSAATAVLIAHNMG